MKVRDRADVVEVDSEIQTTSKYMSHRSGDCVALVRHEKVLGEVTRVMLDRSGEVWAVEKFGGY